MKDKWVQTPDGWEATFKKGKVIITHPDSLGQCEIHLQTDQQEQCFGYEFGSDAAKKRAEAIFKGYI